MALFAPEALTYIGSVPITNTLTNTLLVDSFIVGFVVILKKNLSIIPSIFQNIIEIVIDGFYKFVESIALKNTQKIFPFVMTFFIFILVSNWSGLIPGLGEIGFFKTGDHTKTFIPLFRNTTSDLNTTFALALISLTTTHILSIQTIGIKQYLGKFFSLNPIVLFVGILEIVSEFTKIISLSFRLFGNIFAGEVVLHTISKMFAFVFPVPFLLLEIIVGLVQALVFSLLTMVFMSVLMTHHGEKDH